MLNKEKYAKEIMDIALEHNSVAIVNSKPYCCEKIDSCKYCELNHGDGDCDKNFQEWANSEYKEKEIDWSKVPVDTPILITDSCYTIKRHFAKYYNNTIYSYPDGKTSWSFNQNSNQLVDWDEKNVQIKEGVDCSEWYKD